MRIVVFSSCGARATYILRRVLAEHDVCALVHVVGAAGKKDKPRSLSAKLAKLRAPVKTVTDRGATAYRSWRMAKNERELSQRLFDRDTPPLLEKVTKVPRDRLHAAETLAWLRSLDADLFLVVSAPLLKPELFTIAKSGAVNVHFGIAPQYRGEHTLFWPLYRGDYENIGVTLHYLDAGVDTGRVLGHAFVEIEPDDGEVSLLAKATRATSALLSEFLAVASTRVPEGAPQVTTEGRQYLRRERKLTADAELWLRRFLRRPPRVAARVERFF